MNDLTENTTVIEAASLCENLIKDKFSEIDNISQINTKKVIKAFQKHRVSDTCFAGTNGYGYNDRGREVLDLVFAEIFDCEAALVRTGFVNGTHAIACALYGALKHGDKLLSVMGAPYDTIQSVIGITGNNPGSLLDLGINYHEVPVLNNGSADFEAIRKTAEEILPELVLIQRSRGYSTRKTLLVKDIERICKDIKQVSPNSVIIVDNCYGEFTETYEPTKVGADLIAGSLIKNPGGGIAPCGGYVAGKESLVQKAAYRLTVPGVGGECGATLNTNLSLFQGLFLAPHVVAQAVKTSLLCAKMAEHFGFETYPSSDEPRSDIIQCIKLGTPELLKSFCRGIQSGSAVDSFVSPEPWQMPGYDCEVIMAAGAFIQGSSIELSADAPLRMPYNVFVQGGLTYESGKYGIINAFSQIIT